MSSFNKVILIGNLTADPELKQTTSGISVCSFKIAVNRKMAKNGECDFFNIETWRQTAEFVSRYFKKGKPILVCGQLQNDSWEDQQGNKRTSTKVVADEVSFVGSNDSTAETKTEHSTYTPAVYNNTASTRFEAVADDGNLPF
jgi:single-strand DNA-binding protein